MPATPHQDAPSAAPRQTELLQGFKTAVQIGAVVRDLEQSMRVLTERFGIGPFRVVELPLPEGADQQFLRGAPARFRTRQAFADLGTVELELIQPLEGISIWSEFLERHGPGLHHVRFNLPNLAAVTARLQSQGIGVTQAGAGIRDGTYWSNFDTEELIGFTIEAFLPAPGTDGRTPRSVKGGPSSCKTSST